MDSTHGVRLKLIVLAAFLAACDARSTSLEAAHSRPAAAALSASALVAIAPPPAKIAPCPPGRWRLTPEPVLANVVLWLSHVLIRYKDAPLDRDVNFSLAYWRSAPAPQSRTRAEALELARRVAGLARSNPKNFPKLAREYTEDDTTKATGGLLGGVQAHTLALWPEVLDCVALLEPGSTSDVIETPYGFHVFQRLPVPAEATVSGAEIVIAHDDAGWLEVVNGRPSPRRSRADAQALAQRVYEEAKASRERFDALVAKYSEHVSATRKGDFGAWSTREPTPYPREVSTLAALRAGDVAAPIDSPLGFRILQRTPERLREQLAMSSIRLAFDESNATAEETTRNLATLIAEILQKEPKRFEEFQRQYCCTSIEQWEDGRGSVPLTEVLASLPIGQTRLKPVRADGTYVILRRVDAEARTKAKALFEMPAPARPDVDYYVSKLNPAAARDWLRDVTKDAGTSLALDPEHTRRLSELHAAFAESSPTLETPRAVIVQGLFQDMRRALGTDAYQRYRAMLEAHIERLVLNPPR